MLIANLFALEAVHLAEAARIPLVMAHPYPAPATLPHHFKRRFRMNDPQAYLALHKNVAVRKDQGEVSWLDVEHWMWPVYTDSWSDLRTLLGLNEDGGSWLVGRLAIPVLYLYHEMVYPRPGYWPGKCACL